MFATIRYFTIPLEDLVYSVFYHLLFVVVDQIYVLQMMAMNKPVLG